MDNLRWYRATAWGFAIACIAYASYGCWRNYTDPAGVDFVSFWAAAQLAIQGNSALAYDVSAHRLIELSAGPVNGLMPFAYPPPFLLMLLPLGILPFWLSFAIWVTVTGALYVIAARTLIKGPYALANPAAHLNALNGQNGFFTSGLFIGGMALLDRRPLIAGAVLGLLCIKPQIAMLVPVALVAGGRWRALFGATGSAAALLSLATALFGFETYRAFFDILPIYMDFVRSGQLHINQFASLYGLIRYCGAPEAVCVTAHSVVAVAATIATWRAWREESVARVPILAAASLLISPYLYSYDTLLLTVPLAFLLLRGDRASVALIWSLTLIPLVAAATGLHLPNTLSLAAIAALWALHRNAIAGRAPAPSLAGHH